MPIHHLSHGRRTLVGSRLDGPLGPLDQQGIDAVAIQREIGINRRTNAPDARGKYRFDWVLTIYMHPGILAVFPVVQRTLAREAPAPVKKLAARLNKLATYERDWYVFHNFALHASSLKGVEYLLKRFGA